MTIQTPQTDFNRYTGGSLIQVVAAHPFSILISRRKRKNGDDLRVMISRPLSDCGPVVIITAANGEGVLIDASEIQYLIVGLHNARAALDGVRA